MLKKSLLVLIAVAALLLPVSAHALTLIAPEWNDDGGNYFAGAPSTGGAAGNATIMSLSNLTAATKYLNLTYADQVGRTPGVLTAALGPSVGITFRPILEMNDQVTLNFAGGSRVIPHAQRAQYFDGLSSPASVISTGGSGSLKIEVYNNDYGAPIGAGTAVATTDVVGTVLQIRFDTAGDGSSSQSRAVYPMIIK